MSFCKFTNRIDFRSQIINSLKISVKQKVTLAYISDRQKIRVICSQKCGEGFQDKDLELVFMDTTAKNKSIQLNLDKNE